MSTEPRAAVRWAIQRLNAVSDLTALIASGAVWQVLPRAADTQALPGVAVEYQSTSAPTGALQTGPRTWTAQQVTLRVQTSQQTWSTAQIEAVESLLLTLLDGVYAQPLPEGELIECHYLTSPGVIREPFGDEQVITSTMFFSVSLKVRA